MCWVGTLWFSVTTLLLCLATVMTDACQQCLIPALHRHHQHHHQIQSTQWLLAANDKSLQLASAFSGVAVWENLVPQRAIMKRFAAGALVGAVVIRVLKDAIEDGEKENKETLEDDSTKSKDEKPPLTSAMVATIGVYKNFISPLLPPACRFLPTCSQYGVQAIEKFGPAKGSILTAWRLLRCSPFGGKGYDPPRWPPVPYTYSSY